MFDVIYQTRVTVFHRDKKKVENTTRNGVFLTKFEVFGYPDKTLSRVFDLSSQSKQKLRSRTRNKIVKIYANQDRVSEPSSQL